MNEILEIRDLKTYFHTDDGIAKAVDGVSFKLHKGETLGIVGESGCGKSVTALSILKLLPEGIGKIESGKIIFDGKDLTAMNGDEIRRIRGNRIGMIFQEPMTSLNPAYTCGSQIMEVFRTHMNISAKEAREKTIEIMKRVRIPSPEQRFDEYPHQLSGGLRQRVMIAIALACKPDVLIADEPTTALDVTVQSRILGLIKELQEESGMSVMLITHDLGVVAETCGRVVVMYASKIAEEGLIDEIFRNPKHPYTKRLLESIPSMKEQRDKLPTIEGTVPSSLNYPAGCRFRTRCLIADGECEAEPPDIKITETHFASCFKIKL